MKLFISYRRADSDFPAHWICKTLRQEFGQESVFIDVDAIPLGVDFREFIDEEVNACDVMLAIIGDRWLGALNGDGQRRLDDPEDLVHVEIRSALERQVSLVPVVVGNAKMPSEGELPKPLARLSYLQAIFFPSGRDFDIAARRLINGLKRVFEISTANRSAATQAQAVDDEHAVDFDLEITPRSAEEKGRQALTYESFFAELASANVPPAGIAVAQKLYGEFSADERYKIEWRTASFSIRLRDPLNPNWFYTILVVNKRGVAYMGWLDGQLPRSNISVEHGRQFVASAGKLFGKAIHKKYTTAWESSVNLTQIGQEFDNLMRLITDFAELVYQLRQEATA